MPAYDCGDPECAECRRAFGPDRSKAIANYKAREAQYAALACEPAGILSDPNVSDASKDGVRGETANAAYCTVVFQCDLKRFEGNPFKTETLFGRPVSVGIGDALAKDDDRNELLEALNAAIVALENSEPAQSHYPEPRSRHADALAVARAVVAKATGAQK
jgi:hypothetical protein